LDRKALPVSRARISRIARDENSAGEAALAGLLFLARTLKEEELLNSAEIRALFDVMTDKLPSERHEEVRSILQPA